MMHAETRATLLAAGAATGSAVRVMPGRYTLAVWGTPDGATIKLQFSPDGGTTWLDFPGVSLTAAGMVADLALGAGTYRANIASAGASTSLSMTLFGVE